MGEFDIQTGVITAVRFDEENGRQVPKVDIQSHTDLAIIQDIRIDTPLFAQHIPVVGQVVTFSRVGSYFTRILAVHGERAFDAPIQPGELMVESTGGGFMYLNKRGDVILSDETLSNVMKMLSKIGILIIGDSLSINIKGVGQINITPADPESGEKSKIEFAKVDGVLEATFATAKLTITDDKVVVDGAKVEIGRGQDPVKGGVVVSQSGLTGPHSFDAFTGRPIPQSAAVEATIFPSVFPGAK